MIITPKTKIYDLLEAHPEVEDELIRMVPAFSKLKNPLLRRTIGKVTSLQQAAIVGNVPLENIISCLREVLGENAVQDGEERENRFSEKPTWLEEEKIRKTLDARPLLAQGDHPVDVVNRECNKLEQGEIFELLTDFIPVPLIEMIEKKGFRSYYTIDDNQYLCKTYFIK